MATSAPSPLASSVEKTNGSKLSRLLIDGGTTVLRKVFDGHHPPANLIVDFSANYSILNNLLRRRVLNGHQWDKLFPPGGVAPDPNTFDITLLFLLLTNICGLTPPRSGWHTKPPPSDTSHEANLARVKFYRNVLYGHVTTTGVDTPTFSTLWNEISGVLVSLGLDQAEVDRLKAEKGGEQDYIDVLIEWADSEEDIKSQMKNIHQSQTKTQQVIEHVRQVQAETQKTVEDVHQTQVKTQKTVKDIHQTQAKTQKTVEDVHQTQVKTQKRVENIRQIQVKTQKTVEDIHQTHTKTQKTVEDIHQTQTKTQQTVEEVSQNVKEVAAGLKEVKGTVDSLKDGKDKSEADEVLLNLAKSEFIGDIEYYLERFQKGTREWVFDKVQNWLDDRSSQNRVMVISGNAGMGKSVIAAVICKRMQEAGRLLGSHFCQYNNVRYCKPQLMIQSLACHLSHIMPEYKRALVKQLSRNLGTDLNNMGLEELFSLLFKESLNAVVDPGRDMLIVIDGLDESEYQGRNELLNVIANQFFKLPLWIRFVVTTRPSLNIAEKLKHLKPFELKSNNDKNLEDIRVFYLNKLRHAIEPENVDKFVERLVLKSEGLMLYAHFLVLALITENTSILNKTDLDGSLPLGISSVYHSYFKRLENELMHELDVKEEHFLNLVSAITASREPLPVEFVSKVLVPSTKSPLAKRKVLRALGSVSTLLPIRDDCLHVIHKSVKDWLTDTSCYGEHEFMVDENSGHRILAALCTDELDYLKRKGVHNVHFSAIERYALYHAAHHMLHEGVKREPHKLNELTKAYVMDLEIVYAKTCVNSTTATEELLWLKEQGISTFLSKDNQSILATLLFLMRKFLRGFTDTPRVFLQTILNHGGKVLTAEASNLLRNKYPEIPYMEDVHKETQQRGLLARFKCSSVVVCLDVSPQLDYMVCECSDGMLQLWSLLSGRLVWTRPVIIEKSYDSNYDSFLSSRREKPSAHVPLFRSVVFHPTKELVLPGILSQAYTMHGDLIPLFPGSNCRFSVCSISGDKTKILTNCLQNSKRLVWWNLENGSEFDRMTRDEDILSFAWSRDGGLLAISHSSGLICLVDVMHGFRTLAQRATREGFGMLKFSPDYRSLSCCHVELLTYVIRLSVVEETHHTFSLDYSFDNDVENLKSPSDCGLLFGDLICLDETYRLMFFLDEQRLLRCNRNQLEMVDTKNIEKSGQSKAPDATAIALSLDGQTVYVASDTSVAAWDVLSGKLKVEKNFRVLLRMCAVRGGVLIETRKDTVELWDNNLSKRIKRWTNLPGVKKMIPISEERVAIIRESEVKFLDTSSGEFVSTVLHGSVVTCNRKCQLALGDSYDSLQLLDGTTVVWKKDVIFLRFFGEIALFSPAEQFLVVSTYEGLLVLNADTGNTLHTIQPLSVLNKCEFISDEECVISSSPVKLFNVKSGDLLTAIDVESDVTCLAACPFKRLFAIGLQNSTPNFKVIKVHLSRGEDSGNRERATLSEEEKSVPPQQNNQQAKGRRGAEQSENVQEDSKNSQVQKKSCCVLL